MTTQYQNAKGATFTFGGVYVDSALCLTVVAVIAGSVMAIHWLDPMGWYAIVTVPAVGDTSTPSASRNRTNTRVAA